MTDELGLAEDAFDGCFGCGPTNPVGLKLAFSEEAGSVVCRTRLAADFAGYKAFAHGGVVATLLDEAMGWGMFHLTGRHGVTRSLRVEYKRPVPLMRQIVVRAQVLSRDGSAVAMQSSVEDERGRLLASAEGDWVAVRAERAGR